MRKKNQLFLDSRSDVRNPLLKVYRLEAKAGGAGILGMPWGDSRCIDCIASLAALCQSNPQAPSPWLSGPNALQRMFYNTPGSPIVRTHTHTHTHADTHTHIYIYIHIANSFAWIYVSLEPNLEPELINYHVDHIHIWAWVRTPDLPIIYA